MPAPVPMRHEETDVIPGVGDGKVHKQPSRDGIPQRGPRLLHHPRRRARMPAHAPDVRLDGADREHDPLPYSVVPRELTASRIRLTTADTGWGPRSSPVRSRTATTPPAASRAPHTSMYGTFCTWASRMSQRRVFRSFVHASARIPAARSSSVTPSA